MKTQFIIRLICLFFLMSGWIAVHGQSDIEVPGDNFSLEGALELFKKSASPEEFERMLNDPDSRVNNLDLNGDGYIDYMRVYDINEGNVHAFVIQAVISDRESQDVAVITLEKLANGKAVLQITGDEDIYGIETIIEPTQEVRTYAGTTSSRVVVNVWAWPSVRYIYGPYYSAWVSPWGWGYRPHWYHPWRPVVYYDYYSYWRPYYSYYSPCYTHRVVFAHRIYRSYRTTSVIVHERHYRQITHYRSSRIDNKGYYRENSSRSGSRQVSSAARYNANGRLSSSSSQTVNSRSSANGIEQRGTNSRNSSSENAARSRSYNRSSLNDRKSTSENAQRSRERVSGNSGNSPSSGRISGNSNVQRSTGNSGNQRSSGYSNSRQSSDNSNINRSTPRSSGSSSGINRASGSSNSRQSTGNSSVQRSSGRSSSGANVQRSGGNSNSRQSSGSSSVQRSSGRSSGNANVQRSSGNSGTSRSSGSSSSRQSSSSNSRGRH